MTIKEIARESGYGVGTVSRVLNNSPNVSEEAREAILEVVRRHHFKPNANAKHLKLQTRLGIAIIVKGTQNMLFAMIVEKMQALIEKSGYATMIYYIDQDANEVRQAELICVERKPYGIVFMGSNLVEYGKQLAALEVPCILVTSSAAELNLNMVSSISIDDTTAAGCVVDHLYAQGHRRIGMIGGDIEKSRPSYLRMVGCQSAFFRHKLTFDPERQYAYARFSLEGGYQATEKLLAAYPEMTAIFAMSDIMAIGAIRALHDHGKKVPEDISVVGYDGIELANYILPKLTTIRQNAVRMAERGTEILLHCIQDEVGAIHEIIPFELQEGDSVRTITE